MLYYREGSGKQIGNKNKVCTTYHHKLTLSCVCVYISDIPANKIACTQFLLANQKVFDMVTCVFACQLTCQTHYGWINVNGWQEEGRLCLKCLYGVNYAGTRLLLSFGQVRIQHGLNGRHRSREGKLDVVTR